MIETKRLYQEDSYLKEFEAIVIDVNGNYIILDKSAFIPIGGGLPNDTGIIKKDAQEYKVIFAINKNNNISLEVDKEGLKINDKVYCKLDWQRRYRIMQYHTAIHALSSIIHKNTGSLITGNQIDLNYGRIDLSLENFNRERIKEFIEETNKALRTNQKVTISYLKREEAEKQPELARLAKGLPQGIEILRIVQIGNIDKQADGGPHVNNTSEIPNLIFLKAENKGKDNRRIYFKLED